MYLNRNPLCVECGKARYTVEAALVDHIIPLSQGGADTWDNYQSLCIMHHNKKTAEERNADKEEVTVSGSTQKNA